MISCVLFQFTVSSKFLDVVGLRLLRMLCINSIKCLYVKVKIKIDFPFEAEHYRYGKCTMMLTTPNINYCQWQIVTTLIIFCDMSKTDPCCMYKVVFFKPTGLTHLYIFHRYVLCKPPQAVGIICTYYYTECPGGNVPDFGRMFFKLKYTDITKNTYIRS